jgi:hypothetical protein
MARTIGFSIDGDEPLYEDAKFENVKIGDWVYKNGTPNSYGWIVEKKENFVILELDTFFNLRSDPINKEDFDNLNLKKVINAIKIIAAEL